MVCAFCGYSNMMGSMHDVLLSIHNRYSKLKHSLNKLCKCNSSTSINEWPVTLMSISNGNEMMATFTINIEENCKIYRYIFVYRDIPLEISQSVFPWHLCLSTSWHPQNLGRDHLSDCCIKGTLHIPRKECLIHPQRLGACKGQWKDEEPRELLRVCTI